MKTENDLIVALNNIRQKHNADGVKAYFINENNYRIKVIKDGKVVAVYKEGSKAENSRWDVK